MKKLLITTLLSVSMTGLFAQEIFTDKEFDCSRSKFYKNHTKASKDIIQTHLLHDYDVNFYHLDLAVEDTTVFISGNVSIHARVLTTTLDTFACELLNSLTVDSIKYNGQLLSFNHTNDEILAALENPLPQGSDFSIRIFYHGTPPTGGFFSGITSEYDSTWNKNVTWTLSEPFNARQWWPTKQVLTDKADSVWVFLTTNSKNKAGSIGILTDEILLPDSKIRYEWKSNYPIAYYLISFAVAEYQEYNIYAKPYEMQGDSILIQNYIYNTSGCLSHYQDGIDRTITLLETFSDLYTLYPFYKEKYGHCLTSLSGGMEHQTMTTIGGFGLGLVSHELGHMWFGDNVTCATWSDIWINEGFATYTDYLAHEILANPIYIPIWLNFTHNRVLSEPGGSVYIPPEEIEYDNVSRIFDKRLSYSKGALIIHMIRYELQDDDLFYKVLQNFQTEFKDSTATGMDFMEILNETSGMDFNVFFDQWYFGEGYPVFTVNWNQKNGTFNLSSIQNTSAPEVIPMFTMHVPYKLFFADGTDTTLRLLHNEKELIYSQYFDNTVDSILVDPDLWVINKVESINSVNDNHNELTFGIYPNPAREKLRIAFALKSQKEKTISVYNLSGDLIKVITSINSEIVLDISQLSSSVYFIIASDGKYNHVNKFVKID